jgi:hypothetical protein
VGFLIFLKGNTQKEPTSGVFGTSATTPLFQANPSGIGLFKQIECSCVA